MEQVMEQVMAQGIEQTESQKKQEEKPGMPYMDEYKFEVSLPDASETFTELSSKDILPVIQAKVIKTANLDSKLNMNIPAYILDFSQLESVLPCTLIALKSMLNPDKEDLKELSGEEEKEKEIINSTHDIIYVYTRYDGKYAEIGYGTRNKLARTLKPYINTIFGTKVEMFVSEDGINAKPIKDLDAKSILLDI